MEIIFFSSTNFVYLCLRWFPTLFCHRAIVFWDDLEIFILYLVGILRWIGLRRILDVARISGVHRKRISGIVGVGVDRIWILGFRRVGGGRISGVLVILGSSEINVELFHPQSFFWNTVFEYNSDLSTYYIYIVVVVNYRHFYVISIVHSLLIIHNSYLKYLDKQSKQHEYIARWDRWDSC